MEKESERIIFQNSAATAIALHHTATIVERDALHRPTLASNSSADDLTNQSDDICRSQPQEDNNSSKGVSEAISTDPDNQSAVVLVHRYQRKSRKSRKKSYYRSGTNPFPRIIKSDIKRAYPIMLVNASNSCDWRVIFSFYNLYFTPDCICDKNAIHPISGELLLLKRHFGMMDFLTTSRVEGMPVDIAFQLLNASVTRLACNAGCSIHFTVKAMSRDVVKGMFIAHLGTLRALEVLAVYEKVMNTLFVDIRECVLITDVVLTVGEDNFIRNMQTNSRLAIGR